MPGLNPNQNANYANEYMFICAVLVRAMGGSVVLHRFEFEDIYVKYLRGEGILESAMHDDGTLHVKLIDS